MCFSAGASFGVGAYLLGLGALTVRQVRHPRELPFASIPLLFAVQQLSEGLVWLGFRHDTPGLHVLMAQVYSFFSHVLWPVYIPATVALMEPLQMRRRILGALVFVGLGVGAYLLYYLLDHPVTARQSGRHIEYLTPPQLLTGATLLYAVATIISLMLSSHRMVRVFGVLALLSFAFAYGVYETWFISVWCFFAAVLSTVVGFHFFARAQARVSPA
jgi:hypothetical protein